ncbi:MAG: hypothetical protein GF409_00970 [Candidatus Omnitrophica bacterium]|nr:hypothetical protein [Candidatus Omnitrophota bacterium]
MKIKTRRYYIYYLLRSGLFLLSLFPLKAGLFLARLGGKVAFRLLEKYRMTALENLSKYYGRDEQINERTAEGVFVNLAKNGAEWIKLYSMPRRYIDKIITEVEGAEKLDAVLSEGRGAVVMGFHFGNWELLGIGLREKGYEGALVGRKIYFHKYDKLITRMRGRFDARTIYRDQSPREMLKVLRQGKVLGIVPDQDVKGIDGVFVDFFGQPAYTPTAPVKLAMAARTKIVPVLVIRKQDDTHKIVVEEPIEVKKNVPGEDAVKFYTQKWSDVLEKYVRLYPEQWVWIHKRWKTKIEDKNRAVEHTAPGVT